MINNSDIPDGYKATELGVFPQDWEIEKIDRIGGLIRGVSYKAADLGEKPRPGFLPVLRAMNIQTGRLDVFDDLVFVKQERISEKQMLRDGDIVIAMSSGSKSVVGKSAQLHNNWEGSFGAFCACFRPCSDMIDKEFIGFLFQTNTYREYIEKLAAGTNIKNLTIPHILNYQIPLPPLPEQHAIATTLRTVQEAKEKTEAVIAATKALKAAMMKHLFTYGPVPLEEADKVVLKETEIGPMPEGWKVKSLKEVSKIYSGGTPSKDKPEFWKGEIPWASPKDLKSLVLNDVTDHISEEGLTTGSRLVPENSIFIVIRGMILIRDVPVSLITRPMAFNQDMKAICPNADTNPMYLLYALFQYRMNLSPFIGTSAHGTKRISTSAIEDFLIPIPPKKEQSLIVDMLNSVEKKLAAEQSKKEALDTLFNSLLHDLMTAKIRVAPAEVG